MCVCMMVTCVCVYTVVIPTDEQLDKLTRQQDNV